MENSENRIRFPSSPLNDVFVENGYSVTVIQGKKYYSYNDVNGLGKAICSAIVLKSGRLNALEIRYLRKKFDLTQLELAELIGTKEQTYMQWERADRPIPQTADLVIRCLAIELLRPSLSAEAKKLKPTEISGRNKQIFATTEYISECSSNGWVVKDISVGEAPPDTRDAAHSRR